MSIANNSTSSDEIILDDSESIANSDWAAEIQKIILVFVSRNRKNHKHKILTLFFPSTNGFTNIDLNSPCSDNDNEYSFIKIQSMQRSSFFENTEMVYMGNVFERSFSDILEISISEYNSNKELYDSKMIIFYNCCSFVDSVRTQLGLTWGWCCIYKPFRKYFIIQGDTSKYKLRNNLKCKSHQITINHTSKNVEIKRKNVKWVFSFEDFF